ncbi:hypothetical protein KJ969_02605 [Patescibacteria group bacterium]|nr:hypothetical protein [Patescibacteria group bacterium]MBU1922372.1 hypothetical protein [Patescibacteria group bacterium]
MFLERIIQKFKGFTLLGIILYVGMTAVILIAATYFSIDATKDQAKAYIIVEVNQNFRFAMDRITRAIRQAKDITSLDSQTLVLDRTPDPSITLEFDEVDKKVTYRVGAGPVQDLTTSRVLATGSFSDRSSTSTKNVYINLNIEFDNQGTDIDFSYSSSASTTVELRGY